MAGLTFERTAILGATGPTGFHLAQALRRRGIACRLVARNREKLARAFRDIAAEQVTADMTRAADTARAIEGCDLVVDCIGLAGSHMAEHSVTARNIAAAVRESGARCVQVSSYWAYLPAVQIPISERHPRQGGGEWIRARRAAEDILQEAGAAILNLPDFFGPRVHTSTLQQALGEAAAGKAMNWVGSADIVHEYAFVPDAMAVAAELATRAEAYGERWIVPGSGPVTGRQIADIASRHLGRRVAIRSAGPLMLRLVSLFNKSLRGFMQMVPDYQKPITYDAAKLSALIGKPFVTGYEEAIRQTLAWLSGTGEGAPR
ncbi:MAG: NAD(P)H-binding protein [Betaproteobacteria bacterium]|jgi:nucleoside-diphosphate-sugar epimerase|nr:NAD(P)H-binding protein [Betaproteobacteria bacterium]